MDLRIRAPIRLLLGGATLIFAAVSAKPYLPVGRSETEDKFWLEILPLFVAELGVALVVAFCVAWGIDSRAKRLEAAERERESLLAEQKREAERLENLAREQKMVEDVFSGVLGIRHSSNYVRKVIETTLERRVVRRSINLIYTLSRIVGEDAKQMGVEEGRFMLLEQAISFVFQNLSTEDEIADVKFAVAVRHGRNLRDECTLYRIAIGDRVLTDAEIEEEADPEPNDSKKYSWKETVPRGGRLSVSAKIRSIKEESDTEVWCSFYPCTEGMTLQVVAPKDLRMGIRNNTASKHKMETDPCDNGVGVWKIEGPILPNDSVVFYWRTPEDDGEPQFKAAAPSVQSPIDGGGEVLQSTMSAEARSQPAELPQGADA